jgi:hypothetical protein
MKGIVERLRARLITIPKPGTQPFKPVGSIEMTCGGGPFKAGDDAGLRTVPLSFAHPSSESWVQQHVYAVEPICAEAADEIESLKLLLTKCLPELRNLTQHCEACEGSGEILGADESAEACLHCKPIRDLIDQIEPPKPPVPQPIAEPEDDIAF